MRVAIVGAGLAGLAAARDLADAGHEVVIFEKSRGAGGRTSARRSQHGRFDHGAPYLHDGEKALAIDAAPALARHDLGTVGEPAGNAPARALAAGLDLRPGVRVGTVVADGSGWRLSEADGAPLADADAVIVTAPAPQAARLLPDANMAARAARVTFAPCWVVMAAWADPLDLPLASARDSEGLAWAVARHRSPAASPGSHGCSTRTRSSRRRCSRTRRRRWPSPCSHASRRSSGALAEPVHLAAHRWRYAHPLTPLPEPFLRAGSLLAAGDWCGGTDAGAALRSGHAAAASLLASC